jgi:hypothetical protein
MPDKIKKLVRARMAKTGESYQTALRHIRATAPNSSVTLEDHALSDTEDHGLHASARRGWTP